VSGCSRNGKGAFIVGALDGHIVFTIPQESGSRGAACWRISDDEKAAGKNIQTAGEIIGENAWFGTPFNTYAMGTPRNFGLSLVGVYGHCAFPSSQTTDLDTYIAHSLINGGMRDIKQVQTSSAKVTLSTYCNWFVPTLL
jgi:hypothetical protein